MAVLQAKLVITAADETGAAFAKIEERVAAISRKSAEVGRISSAVGRTSGAGNMASEFERAEKAVSKFAAEVASASSSVARMASEFGGVSRRARGATEQVSLLSRAIKQAKHISAEISPLVMGGAGFGILETTKKFVEGGAEIQGERARMGVAGIPANEIARADLQSAALAAHYTNVSRASILETYKEARSVLLHPEETPEMMPSIIAAKSAMQAAHPHDEHASEGLQFAVKGAEVMGIAQNPARFRSYLDSFIKAQQVMGKTITPEQQFQFAQMVKSSGIMLSDRFKMTTGVSLAQEMKGGMTGQAVDQFVKQIVGGFQGNNHSAAKEFVALDLAKKSDFDTTKTGEIKGMKHGRKVAGADLAGTDPDKWVYDYLLPAMEKKGITSLNDQISQVRRMFPAGRAADLVSKMISQRESFANHAKLYSEATGLEGGQTLVKEDPTAALNALGVSISNFGATLTSPIMKQAASTMASMASQIGAWGEGLTKWQADNPALSKVLAGGAITGGLAGGGALGYGLISGLTTGFGLKGSAVALDASAAALDAAAARLGGGGPGGVAGGSAAAKGASPMEKALGIASWATVQGWLYETGKHFISSALPEPKNTYKGARDLGNLSGRVYDDLASGYSKIPAMPGRWSHGIHIDPPSGYARDFTLGSTGTFSQFGKLQPPGGLGYMSHWDQSHVAQTPLGRTFDPSMLSGKIEANIAPGQITAKMEGSADVHVTVTVTPSDNLIKAVATATAASKGNVKASVGTSMPEANPAGRTGTGKS